MPFGKKIASSTSSTQKVRRRILSRRRAENKATNKIPNKSTEEKCAKTAPKKSAPANLPTPSTVAAREIVLGKGSYGTVVKIFGKSGGYLARKRLKSIAIMKEGIESSTIRECTLLRILQHPNIIQAYGMEIDKAGNVDIFMPVASEDLLHFIQNTPSYEKRITFLPGVTCALIDALAYMHNAKLLHRDVKPANVLLRYDDRKPASSTKVWLTDFGASRNFSAKECPLLLTPNMVTYAYRAPEMKEEYYNDKSDIYSLGCSLIHLLAGDYPRRSGVKNYVPPPSEWVALLRSCKRLQSEWVSVLIQMVHTDYNQRPSARQLTGNILFKTVAWKFTSASLSFPKAASSLSSSADFVEKHFSGGLDQYLDWLVKSFRLSEEVRNQSRALFLRVGASLCDKYNPTCVLIASLRLVFKFTEYASIDIDVVLKHLKNPCTVEDITQLEIAILLLCDFCVLSE